MLFASKLGWPIVVAVVRGNAICKKIAQKNSAAHWVGYCPRPTADRRCVFRVDTRQPMTRPSCRGVCRARPGSLLSPTAMLSRASVCATSSDCRPGNEAEPFEAEILQAIHRWLCLPAKAGDSKIRSYLSVLDSIESLTCRHMFTNITTKAGVEKNCKVKDVTPKNHMIVIIALFL
jgi:hypothetical protein